MHVSCQGRAILDNGLHVTWGDGNYWVQRNEATSPRGVVWRLNQVCWLSVKSIVRAPRPGVYAAFFRVRQVRTHVPLLNFSAEWKADATTSDAQCGFLRRSPARPPSLRQESEGATVSWSHWNRYDEANQGGWLLLHIGNILVRERGVQLADSDDDGDNVIGGSGSDVAISFGGENPHWCSNIEVDFAAIAPLRLSWEIERVVMIGSKQGHIISGAVEEIETGFNDTERSEFSPLSTLPQGVIGLIIEFSQPTLVRPQLPDQVLEEGSHNIGDAGMWNVF